MTVVLPEPELSCIFNIMRTEQPNNPLHGLTLEMILIRLVETYGWDEMARYINIMCFKYDPNIKSCLNFLRKTSWARRKVEDLYLASLKKDANL